MQPSVISTLPASDLADEKPPYFHVSSISAPSQYAGGMRRYQHNGELEV
jgi:hypothetical protein